jgi:hypothetical protein
MTPTLRQLPDEFWLSAHKQLSEINENPPKVAQKWALFIGEYIFFLRITINCMNKMIPFFLLNGMPHNIKCNP